MTLPGSHKPSFIHCFGAKEATPAVWIEAKYTTATIPFLPIRPEELQMQWYGKEFLDVEGRERDEVIRKPVGRGWGFGTWRM